MRTLAWLIGLLATAVSTTPTPVPADSAAAQIQKLVSQSNNNLLAQFDSGLIYDGGDPSKPCKCDPRKAAVRREWGTLSPKERKAYTDAVLCLQKKKPLSPFSFAPGVRNRLDDFVATHINQTNTIHFTTNFLSWHRYFTWAYEKALQDNCGYTGTQPYWDWGMYSDAPQKSPVFNGDAYSMSGTGKPVPHPGNVINIPGIPKLTLPPGLGGGCVIDGPFANMTVNLGPVGSLYLPPNGNGLSYNPRCLARDLNPYINNMYANYSSIFELLSQPENITSFQGIMQGNPAYKHPMGVHGGGHNTIGGDPGADFFASPGDPIFFLHHSQIDRVWTIWQNLDLPSRQYAISGTRTFLNNPPSANGTLDDTVTLGYNGVPDRPIRDLMSTLSGPFCYVYA